MFGLGALTYMKNGALLLTTTDEFFRTTVEEAFEHLNLQPLPEVQIYLVSLLNHFAFTDNLYDFDDETGKRKLDSLAEMYLKAHQKDNPARKQLLKKLGDTSLYISGFFSDSLKRKLIDIDYYIDMGESAYGSLASTTRNDSKHSVYQVFSKQFIQFMDVLTYISQKSMIQTDSDLLRLYDRYIHTGSDLAREQLLEKGLLNSEVDQRKKKIS